MSSNKVVINDSADYTFEVSDALCDRIVVACQLGIPVCTANHDFYRNQPTGQQFHIWNFCPECGEDLRSQKNAEGEQTPTNKESTQADECTKPE